jgi:hypothetical protein
LSRFAADASFALFFYLLGIIFLLKFRDWNWIWAFVFFVLGFFSYNGAKVMLLPIVAVCSAYKLINSQKMSLKKSRTEVIFMIFIILFLVGFGLINKFLPSSIVSDRLSEVVFFNKSVLSNNVGLFRNQSITTPVNPLFVNKITESFRIFIYNYFYALSPNVLFLTGDPRVIYSFYYHGLFYLFDLPLIIVGIIALWKNRRKLFYLILSLIAISPIPTAISTVDQSIVNRSFLLLPLLIMILSYGMFAVYEFIRRRNYRNIYLAGVTAILFIGFINFLFLYFIRLPVLAQENYATSQRVLSKFINVSDLKTTYKTMVIGQEPREYYLHILFYTPNETQTTLLKNNTVSSTSHSFKIQNILFTRDCPSNFSKDMTYIIESAYKCSVFNKQNTSYHIIDQKDAGGLFNIYNSTTCSGVALTGWNNTHKFSDYAIEEMSKENFCKRWISL